MGRLVLLVLFPVLTVITMCGVLLTGHWGYWVLGVICLIASTCILFSRIFERFLDYICDDAPELEGGENL